MLCYAMLCYSTNFAMRQHFAIYCIDANGFSLCFFVFFFTFVAFELFDLGLNELPMGAFSNKQKKEVHYYMNSICMYK